MNTLIEEINTFYRRNKWVYSPFSFLFFNQSRRFCAKYLTVNSKSLSVLEIGAFDNSFKKMYPKNHHYTAIDLLGSEGVIQMNGEEMRFADNTFDVVIMNHVLSVACEPNRMLQEAIRVSKSNGRILITNHFSENRLKKWFDLITKQFYFKSYFPIKILHLPELSIEHIQPTFKLFPIWKFIVIKNLK
jgi:phosphatidylethanolamine/phosphatidyl-N-methylethanolamine N-methyltransferase